MSLPRALGRVAVVAMSALAVLLVVSFLAPRHVPENAHDDKARAERAESVEQPHVEAPHVIARDEEVNR